MTTTSTACFARNPAARTQPTPESPRPSDGLPLERPIPLFGEFAEAWFERQVRLAEAGVIRLGRIHLFRSALRAHLLPFFAARPLTEVTRDRCDDYRVLALTVGHLRPASINGVVEILRLILRDAQRRGLIDRDPTEGLLALRVARRLVEPYDLDEVKRLIRATDPAYRVVIGLAALAGLRQGEIYALRSRDVDLRGAFVEVARSLQRRYKRYTVEQRLGPPKTTSSVRQVPIQQLLRVLLVEHERHHLRPNRFDLYCCLEDGEPLNPTAFRSDILLPAIESADLRPMRFHGLRRSFVAQCVAAGIPATQTAAWLGHSTARMTDYYFHCGQRERLNSVDLLNRAASCNA